MVEMSQGVVEAVLRPAIMLSFHILAYILSSFLCAIVNHGQENKRNKGNKYQRIHARMKEPSLMYD